MSANYKYRGRLSETTLPEMLYSIDRFQMAGLVEATHGETVKRVWLRDGHVVHASSTDRADSLGEHLQRTGQLSEAELEEMSRLRRSSDRRFGALAVERGMLTPEDVLAAIRGHIEEIVWSLFHWRQGDVSFAIGAGAAPAEDMVRIQLPLRRVILGGIRRMPRAKSLVARMGSRETIFTRAFEWEELIEIGLDADEVAMLRLVDGRTSLYQLCSAGPLIPADNARILYAFDVLKLVERRKVADPPSGPVKIRLKPAATLFYLMPLYEYECASCGERLETIQRFSDPPLTECPECSGALTRLISAPAFQFKGTGWYVTDYARGGSKGGADEGGKSAKTEAKASGDGKADTGKTASKGAEAKTAKASAGKGDDG